jgi:hypothetical protein
LRLPRASHGLEQRGPCGARRGVHAVETDGAVEVGQGAVTGIGAQAVASQVAA